MGNVVRVCLLLGLFAAPAMLFAIPFEEVEITVRDGAKLAADVYPAVRGDVKKPTILVQTPYNRRFYRAILSLQRYNRVTALPLDTTSFHYVIVDWRGFFDSRDAAEAGYDRGLDGVDIIDWIRQQEWSDGQVGLWGASALGGVQHATAKHQPEGLVCIVPMVTDIKSSYEKYYYGGALREAQVDALQALGFLTTGIIKSTPTKSFLWRSIETSTDVTEQINVPALVISGWYDLYPEHNLAYFTELQRRSGEAVRSEHRLVFGPWTHSGLADTVVGEIAYPGAAGTMISQSLAFLRHHLLGVENGWDETAAVRYFRLGAENWETAASWPDAWSNAAMSPFYLRSDGTLDRTGAAEAEQAGSFATDPRDPSPTHGGSLFIPLDLSTITGAVDQRAVVESRSDHLTYTTAPMTSNLAITGPIELALYVSTDRTDADVNVRLTEVYPDGRSILLAQGVRRLRFRNGLAPTDTSLVEPGTIEPVTVELQDIALTLRPGHALRIIVTGTNWPHFAINPHTGGPLYEAGDSLTATTRIHTGGDYPSRIILPITDESTSVESGAPSLPEWLDLTGWFDGRSAG